MSANAAKSSFIAMTDANASQPSVPSEGTKTIATAQCCLPEIPQDRADNHTRPMTSSATEQIQDETSHTYYTAKAINVSI